MEKTAEQKVKEVYPDAIWINGVSVKYIIWDDGITLDDLDKAIIGSSNINPNDAWEDAAKKLEDKK